jgi:hypothetical protein
MAEDQRQSCKNCGVRNGVNFHVSDSVWKSVVPKRLLARVVCLACFDAFAARRGVDYRRNIRVLYFAGRQASFEFRVAIVFALLSLRFPLVERNISQTGMCCIDETTQE